MSSRTTADERLPREEVESYLANLAAEFGSEADAIEVTVGNKTVELEPSDAVDLSVDVVERSSKLRGNRETIELELTWKT